MAFVSVRSGDQGMRPEGVVPEPAVSGDQAFPGGSRVADCLPVASRVGQFGEVAASTHALGEEHSCVTAVKGAVGYTIVWKLQRSTQGKAWERKGVSPHY